MEGQQVTRSRKSWVSVNDSNTGGQMTVKRTKADVYIERLFCDSCGTEMEFTGVELYSNSPQHPQRLPICSTGIELTSNPPQYPQYPHVCNKCGAQEIISGFTYPCLDHVEQK